MTWVQVGNEGDVAPGEAVVVEAGGKRLALCNTGEGLYAIDDVCTHDGGPLDQGTLDGKEIECPRHGARFDVTTGRALCLPAVRPVRTYPVRVHNGTVEVEV
ncbi:MAG: non-heme iron oxygenase ferredoxin subunit [Chloroflexi bacterium]|jgi:3-phenylpropionate/trans-cinnamate dioxygenase ferredoxin subunit|nr:non-heme iron oxygenase ferredoxin subunit [Dehalococcoidia bacterium]MCO5202459.1 non-heme iron oxygenase ferredoxin subunit [Chloroflexota bacterium]MCZ7576597.1 non-heme iron oxygenase ferredoxin subunit [Dehalococcoidia bacterium]NJD64168.1 non-heme iron oxygenase ferredoxin subunit [Chloroflexota bacterium]PWB41810.1 MAG: biphenyl 2,3-dioxygenase [Dehalococcoidia bacterium]